jgi:hypothetical protein
VWVDVRAPTASAWRAARAKLLASERVASSWLSREATRNPKGAIKRQRGNLPANATLTTRVPRDVDFIFAASRQVSNRHFTLFAALRATLTYSSASARAPGCHSDQPTAACPHPAC